MDAAASEKTLLQSCSSFFFCPVVGWWLMAGAGLL
jgi:hypothetical protein